LRRACRAPVVAKLSGSLQRDNAAGLLTASLQD